MLASALVTTLLVTALPTPSESEAASVPGTAPLVELDHGTVELLWDRAADGGVTGEAVLRRPTLRLVRRTEEPSAPRPEPPPPGLGEIVRETTPLPVAVDRVEVHDGTIVFVDETVPGGVVLRIDRLEMTLENFSTLRSESGGLPMLVTARGKIGAQGSVALFLTINPWSGNLDFAGRAQVVDLQLEEIAALVQERADVRPTDGRLTTFIEFSVHDGRVVGGIKPILWNVDLGPEDRAGWGELRNWFRAPGVELVAEPIIEILSGDVGGEEALATVVPIRGRIRRPELSLSEAVIGVLENAFLESVSVGFERVAP